MPALNINDLNNGKKDLDHIGEVATSEADTATDRLGRIKLTVRGAINSLKAFNVRGAFVGGTPYAAKDVYTSDGVAYVALTDHVGSTVDADLAAGKVTVHQGATREDLIAFFGSSLIGFIQAGVGAIRQTLQDLLRETIRVSQFGASPSVADNLAAIQAAINEASERGGGQVRLAAGTYKVNGTLILPSKVELVGEGEAATRLQQRNLNAPLIQSVDFATLAGTTNSGGIRRAALRWLTVEGTATAGVPDGANTQHGVQVYGYGMTFESVHIRNFGGIGLSTEWAMPGTVPDSGWDDGFVENKYKSVKVYECGLSGMKINGPHDGQWTMVVCYGNNQKDTSADKPNVWITSKGNPQYIDQLHCWGNTSGVALLAEGSIKLVNCALEGATLAQLRIKTGEVMITGGELFAAGSSSSKGVEFIGGTGVCIGYTIDTTIRGCNGGSIDFGTGVDSAKIKVRLYQTAGTLVLGTAPTAAPGSSLEITAGGAGLARGTAVTHYHATHTNVSLVGTSSTGLGYDAHGGEGVIVLPQRKTEPAGTYYPPDGVIAYGRVNAIRLHQSSSNTVGAILGEPAVAVVAADNLDCSNYQQITLAAAASPIIINSLVGGLNGSPLFLLMPSGGSEITLSTAGNIRSKTGAAITRTGLGSNRLIAFVKARDGNYYQV